MPDPLAATEQLVRDTDVDHVPEDVDTISNKVLINPSRVFTHPGDYNLGQVGMFLLKKSLEWESGGEAR